MSDPLEELPSCLFSVGLRSDYSPHKPPAESHFHFLDRVRQPYFERERCWWEQVFQSYPAGDDKVDVRNRFRSDDDVQHRAAAWELFVFAIWTHHGWTLVPHPVSPGSKVRDFLASHPNHDSFYLECTVANPPEEEMSASRKRDALWHILKDIPRDDRFALRLDVSSVGKSMPNGNRIRADLESAVERFSGESMVLVSEESDDGWRFTISAEPSLAGVGVMAPQTHIGDDDLFRRGVQRPVERKARGASSLDRPYVVAAQIRTNTMFSGVLSDEVLDHALHGSQAAYLDLNTGEVRREDPTADGVLTRRPAVSAVMLARDCGPQWARPTMHINRSATHPLDPNTIPAGIECHFVDSNSGQAARTEADTPQSILGLPASWPGPEDPFEGINTPSVPGPAVWDPRYCDV